MRKSDKNRYEDVIKAALKIRQKHIEIKKLKDKIQENLTASEFIKGSYDQDLCERAILALCHNEFLKLESKNYVGSAIIYKDVEVHLFQEPNYGARFAIEQILKGIKIN